MERRARRARPTFAGVGFCAFLRLFAAIPLPGNRRVSDDGSARERAVYGAVAVRWPGDGRGLRRARPIR